MYIIVRSCRSCDAHYSKELDSCHHSREIQQIIDAEVAKEVTKECQKVDSTIDEYKTK